MGERGARHPGVNVAMADGIPEVDSSGDEIPELADTSVSENESHAQALATLVDSSEDSPDEIEIARLQRHSFLLRKIMNRWARVCAPRVWICTHVSSA